MTDWLFDTISDIAENLRIRIIVRQKHKVERLVAKANKENQRLQRLRGGAILRDTIFHVDYIA